MLTYTHVASPCFELARAGGSDGLDPPARKPVFFCYFTTTATGLLCDGAYVALPKNASL